MPQPRRQYKTIDEYISEFPQGVQAILGRLRSTIKEAAPNATETIKYGIPTFKLHGNLAHFAAYKKNIGFYPAPSAIVAFKEELSEYKLSKGTVQFPIGKEIPFDLVRGIVEFRVKENLAWDEERGTS